MISKNNRAPLLYYIKLCPSFQIHWWIQTEGTVRKRSILAKIGDFFVACDLDIWWMTLEIGHLFHTTSSFVHHFIATSEWIKIRVTVRKPPCWVKIDFFCPVWPSTLPNDFQNNRALLCYFKLCALFRSHWWIQTEATVGKCLIWDKIDDFLAVWPWNLTDDLEKQQGTPSNQHQALCIISSLYVNSNWSYGAETAKLGVDLCDLNL